MSNGCPVNEICSWNPDPVNPGEIQRTERVAAQPRGISRFPQISLNQGHTEKLLLDHLARKQRVHVDRNVTPTALRVDTALCEVPDKYPINARLKRAKGATSEAHVKYESVKARYVVGCDGAHSWVRDQLDIALRGEKADSHFGVMDIVPLTNFPDIRQSCVIHSKFGSVMTVPRENRLVRLYVQLDPTAQGTSPIDPSEATPEEILAYAKPIFDPYHLDFEICDWYSIYTVGQRLATQLDYKERIFLAGDAVHTHSPTLGQGMNISMQDAYNLGWKIGSVLEGTTRREILSTYTAERQPVAEHLIDLDKRMAQFYSQGPTQNSEEYQSFRDQFTGFLSGVTIKYGASLLVADHAARGSSVGEGSSSLAQNIVLGARLPLLKVVCQAEAKVINLSDILPSNGTWRILVLPANISRPARFRELQQLAPMLEQILGMFNPAARGAQPIIEVVTVHCGRRKELNLLDLHPLYHPWDDVLGWDYWKVYADDAASFEPSQSVYDQYGVDRDRGCIVALRPDQHVSCVLSLDEADLLQDHFLKILTPKSSCSKSQ